ncbi:hypothetical protein [Novosphingobium sp. 9]|uniref:hypothetical protein n=1 Tax=Novosphingobium sp. 9 TaxID=2025349 RepID=UPI0021B613B4|nr:hypothetical protein [Novosphingobium sp. 9]
MSGRGATNWQTSLADLSLVLFMIAAAAMGRHDKVKAHPVPPPPSVQTPAKPGKVERSEPVAVWVEAPGAPPLALWLKQQAPDLRQRLTVAASYGDGASTRAEALAEAARIAGAADAAGYAPRIVVEPGQGPVRAVLAYDNDGPTGAN